MPLIEHSEADNKDSTAPRTRHHQIPRVEAPRVEAPRVDAAATSTRKRKAHSERGWNVQRNQTKKYIDGVLQCRRAVGLSEKTPPQSASVLIARCLHEVLLLISAHSRPPSPFLYAHFTPSYYYALGTITHHYLSSHPPYIPCLGGLGSQAESESGEGCHCRSRCEEGRPVLQ